MSEFDPLEYVNMKMNHDGTLTREPIPSSEANPDENSGQGVISKDITLDAYKKTFVRVYRPTKIPSIAHKKLPIILYFHGGTWISFHAYDSITHVFCNQVSFEINVIIVSLEFRLSPEHRLPAQYEDGVDAIKWLQKQSIDLNGEPWLKDYGDFSRCFLYGSSQGGNMAFFCAQRALEFNLEPLKLSGIIMNQPMFGGKQRCKSEIRYATDPLTPLPVLDKVWELSLPKGTDRGHRYCNPMVDGPHKDKLRLLPRCLVIGFGMDPMLDRQQEFVTMLVTAGVQVEAWFDDVGFHGIDQVDPSRAEAVIRLIKEFVYRVLLH